jgi:hypothetical protein
MKHLESPSTDTNILSQYETKNPACSVAKKVSVGVQFDRIGEIDTMNEKFYAELTIEAQWQENKKIEAYHPDSEWNPKLHIDNLINESYQQIKYFVEHDSSFTTVTERRTVKGTSFAIKQFMANTLWQMFCQ